MDFLEVQLDRLLDEMVELQADWMDATAVHVVDHIKSIMPSLRSMGRVGALELENALANDSAFLDVCRLFLGVSQESAAHLISSHLPAPPPSWTQLRSRARTDPAALAGALVAANLPEIIEREVQKTWTIEDVLIDRYKMSRGRAIAGQARGRSLEDRVEQILAGVVPFEQRISFTGREGRTAKCDVAIPNRRHPKIVIEAKGFEATGSKLTDFLGDIGKIIEAKESRTYFFIVTDGRGWLNRRSDLQQIVNRQHQKYVDMIYTSARLGDLARDTKHIWEHETQSHETSTD